MDDMQKRIEEGIAYMQGRALIAELQRRYPKENWDSNPACPDCGSLAHFECGNEPTTSQERVR